MCTYDSSVCIFVYFYFSFTRKFYAKQCHEIRRSQKGSQSAVSGCKCERDSVPASERARERESERSSLDERLQRATDSNWQPKTERQSIQKLKQNGPKFIESASKE